MLCGLGILFNLTYGIPFVELAVFIEALGVDPRVAVFS